MASTLIKKGSHGILRTERSIISNVIWTLIPKGKSMLKLGIVDWTFIDKNNIWVPFRQSERRAKTFWNILRNSGWKGACRSFG
jgi:predicted AlkP superfamily phosphohydrolase/phosphomutase